MADSKISNDTQPDSFFNEIRFDILKIDNRINKESVYQEGENIFQFCRDYKPETMEECDQKTDYLKYIAKIKTPTFQYIGILSKNLKKENYGYNQFDNGDEYFGQWNKDKKEGYGIYFFKEENAPNPQIISQIYVGEFKNNMKSGEGIYFKVSKFSDDKDNKKPLDFDLVIGNFADDIFKTGIVYSMKEGKRKIYRGKMNQEGKKNDEMGELYEDNDKIFFGVIKDNVMMEGRVVIMKDDKKDNGYYFTRKGNNLIDGDVDFDYLKWEEKDDEYIKKLNDLNNILVNEKIQELFESIMKIRDEADCGNNYDYIKNVNFDEEVKQKLKGQYGKYLYW